MRSLFLFFVFAWTSSLLVAQVPKYKVANLHAHNDYEQKIPLKQAYMAGFGSIEVDIFLEKGKLLVAHEENELSKAQELRNLYLAPLVQLLEKDTARELLLLVDLKTTAHPTLKALISELEQFPKLIANHQLRITITGNQPPVDSFTYYPSFIWFDGKPDQSYSDSDWARIALVSANIKKYTNWNGKGVLTSNDQLILKRLINVAKVKDKPFRFWNAPDIPNAWYQLMKLGVGYINTDQIEASSTFMRTLSASSFALDKPLPVYTPTEASDGLQKPPKNIILLIADGMGLPQLQAANTANRGDLNIFRIKRMGLSLTSSYDSYITDSAPGATAFSTGKKTNNRSVGVDHTGKALLQLPNLMAAKGKRTALITSGDITDATPAAFYAHQQERSNSLSILQDLHQSPISILAGSGSRQIDSVLFRANDIQYFSRVQDMHFVQGKKIVVTDSIASKRILDGRGNWLQKAFLSSVDILKKDSAGFFMMIEGAKVDHGGHDNHLPFVITEALDFDQLVAAVLRFADSNGETLVIVTSDHETGGLTLLDGDIREGYVSGHFSTTDHTALPVPYFVYGPGSHLFTGVIQNTEIFNLIMQSLSIKPR